MNLNPAQRIVATTFDRPLAVMAGAGSGKTATLKERIATAFDEGVVNSIDQVLAITFTEKAALELKSRIKSTLRTRGGATAQQALLVDGAWISTIHGMCSRILRENALVLNRDPAFAILAEDDGNNLLDSCIEEVLTARTDLAVQATRLFEEYNRSTLKDMIAALVDKASSTPQGFDAIRGPEVQAVGKNVRAFAELLYEHLAGEQRCVAQDAACAEALEAGATPDEAKKAASAAGKAFDAVEQGKSPEQKRATAAQMTSFVEAHGTSGELNGTSWELPWSTGDADGDKVVAQQNIRLLAANELWLALRDVSQAAFELFQEAKRNAGVFGNNDLLVEAARALENEAVRAQYADKFKLVMIDEFQDTDQTQLDIIKTFAGKNMERLCVVGDPQQSIYRFRGADLSVCQAHVLPLAQLDEAASSPADRHVVYLDENYRSHQAILDFTDLVFGEQPQPAQEAAGDEDDGEQADGAHDEPLPLDPGDIPPSYYQALQHGRDEDRVNSEKPETCFDEAIEGPRIVINEIQHKHGSIASARALGAQQIAERFKQLHEHGKKRSYGDMVILLGAMTHADEYARALAALEIPCAITGGSVFKKKVEPNLVLDLVRALANPYHSEALLDVLASDLFGLGKLDLMQLDHQRGPLKTLQSDDGTTRHVRDNVAQAYLALLGTYVPRLLGQPKKADRGGSAKSQPEDVPAADDAAQGDNGHKAASARLEHSAKVLGSALELAGRVPASVLVRDVLVQSGWVSRQQEADKAPTVAPGAKTNTEGSEAGSVTGLMSLANALKAVRMIEALENEGCTGLRSIAERLAVRLDEAKEAPGVLSAKNSAFVRIMTIHASKGLQFPVVAVAEMGNAPRSRQVGRLTMESVRGTTFAALDLQRSVSHTDREPIEECLASNRKNAGCERALTSVGRTRATDDSFLKVLEAADTQGDAANFFFGLRAFGEEQDREEMERKIYVAFTRAEEALIVNLYNKVTDSNEDFKARLKAYRAEAEQRDPDRYKKPRRNSKKPIEEQEEIEERIRAVEELVAYEKRHLSFVGLAGNLDGIAAIIRSRQSDIALIGGGGAYLCATPPQVEKWAATGTLPPAFGDASSPDALDGALVDWDESAADADEAAADINTGALTVLQEPLRLHPRRYRFMANWAEGILSASAIKERTHASEPPNEPADDETPFHFDAGTDGEDDEVPAKATEKGTAFHAVGQHAAEAWQATGVLSEPRSERIDAIARLHGLSTQQRDDLHAEAKRWFASDVAHAMAARAHLVAEAPFFVPLDSAQGGQELMINGFIDLLAYDEEAAGTAYVVDYKTGTFLASDHDRRAAYGVQAKCYAYALLLQGFSTVELDFVFVDQPDEAGQPSTTHFPAKDEAAYTLEALRDELARLVSQ